MNRMDGKTMEKGHIQRGLPMLPIQKRGTIGRKANTQRKMVSSPQIKNLINCKGTEGSTNIFPASNWLVR